MYTAQNDASRPEPLPMCKKAMWLENPSLAGMEPGTLENSLSTNKSSYENLMN